MFKDTDRVRQAAITFLKKGRFTDTLPGTKDYYDLYTQNAKGRLSIP